MQAQRIRLDTIAENIANVNTTHGPNGEKTPFRRRLVQFAAEAALRMRMPVSICGELAASPKLTPLLLGLGVRSLSMNASAVPKVKQAIRSVQIDACVRFARRVMEQPDPERIRAMIDGFGRIES